MIFEVDGIHIEVSKKSVKNVNLKIYPPEGHVKISVPNWYSEKLIKKVLEEKSAWIRTQSQRLKQSAATASQWSLAFKGLCYPIVYEECKSSSQVLIKGESLHCFIPPCASEAQKQFILESWYKKEMNALIPDLIAHWEPIMKVKVAQWGIKKMKTRWGSCNPTAQRIWLNLVLIQKPPVCLEYVLVHELVHLLEPSHNQKFYALMTHYMPNWRLYKHILDGKNNLDLS